MSGQERKQLIEPRLSTDVLMGAGAIADYIGLTRKQAYGHIERGNLPVFRIGALLCIRKSTILNWIERQERSATEADRS